LELGNARVSPEQWSEKLVYLAETLRKVGLACVSEPALEPIALLLGKTLEECGVQIG